MAALLRRPVHLVAVASGSHIIGSARGMIRPGIGTRPLIDVPVVVRADHGRSLVLDPRIHEQLAAEPGERRKAHRPEHAIGIHVLDPATNVIATGPDLFDAGRLHTEFRWGTARDRVERRVEDLLALVTPCHGPVVAPDEPRGLVLVRFSGRGPRTCAPARSRGHRRSPGSAHRRSSVLLTRHVALNRQGVQVNSSDPAQADHQARTPRATVPRSSSIRPRSE